MKTKIKKLLCLLLILFVLFSCSACDDFGVDVSKKAKNLSTYNINATLNDDAKSLTGDLKLDYINPYEVVMKELRFNLFGSAFREDAVIKPCSKLNEDKCYPNGKSYGDMKILKVEVEGRLVEVQIGGEDNNILIVPFFEELYPGGKIQIKINFLLLLANNTHRLGYYEDNINLGNWFPIACVLENGKFFECVYYANGDPFYSEVANFRVKLTYVSSYVAVGSGVVVDEVVSENFIQKTFEAKCVRDFALVLSKNFEVSSQKLEHTTINYYGYKGDEKEQYLTVAVEAYQTFCRLFGNYPYKELNVVKTSFVHGGMEYPNLVMISDSITDEEFYKTVIVHEIAHQWWYGVVGNNEIKNAWIDEGLAEFSTLLFYRENPKYNKTSEEIVATNTESYSLYVDVIKSINDNLNEQMTLAVNDYASEYEYVYMVYVKGLLMFNNLSETIGYEKLLAGLQHFYKNNKFGIVTADHLIASFEAITKTNMSGFFDSWLEGKVEIVNS